ncbi:FAD-dependent monooxygenase [Mycolicibacterium goodii]|uniref:FAD-dependent monooxygenase n=1 Tax=Mycolicibacterium goodii TaxID=134601 RepID=UPI001BDCD612|nr:FAD-dependent monooxygenase [Mycolicibacterium goodii]MBU8808520.1 FAD-dependent monooxygenase [Mycolicibacterium goodii]MBU8830346.1 FAD-dependent monooxygenase [Mycolicibacterium goodii]
MATDAILVVGAGPTGLMLACELALGGAKAVLLEERTSAPNITRAFAVHARTLELLDGRGLAQDLVARGLPVREVTPPGGVVLKLSELPTEFGMVLIVPQSGTEHLLEARATELGVDVRRGASVVGVEQDADGVTVRLADGDSLRGSYVVGCDGAHSAVRTFAGIDFVGKQYETHILLADVRLASPPEETLFARTGVEGVALFIPFGDGWFRAIVWDRLREQAPLSEPVTLDEIKDAFGRITGQNYGMSDMRWSSRFLSERRQARTYRRGRVFLAGDAAHVHSPLGGQGMNTGLGDALNLGWKLAAVVGGRAPGWLLDSYERERHPVGASVLRFTDAFNQIVLSSPAKRRARVAALAIVLRVPAIRRSLTERLSGIGITYPRSRGEHRLVGRRMPDVDCRGTRLYELLRGGRFVLVSSRPLEGDGDVVSAVGDLSGLPDAVLVRPDGYIAWASDRLRGAADVRAAVAHWMQG